MREKKIRELTWNKKTEWAKAARHMRSVSTTPSPITPLGLQIDRFPMSACKEEKHFKNLLMSRNKSVCCYPSSRLMLKLVTQRLHSVPYSTNQPCLQDRTTKLLAADGPVLVPWNTKIGPP